MSVKLRALAVSTILIALSGAAAAGPRAASDPPPQTLEEAERELTFVDRRLGELDASLGRLVADVALRERRSVARARAYTRLARAGLLPVAGGFDAFVDHAMRIEGARRSLLNDLTKAKDLRREHQRLVATRDALFARRAVVAAQRDTLAQAAQLLAEAEARRASFDRAFEGTGSSVTVYGAGISVRPVDGDRAEGFASLKGRMPFPVAGKVDARVARRTSADGPGVELRAPVGTAVRAVFGGRVAFTGQHGDYGKLVILDHGDRWFSVSANLGSYDVKAGDEVSRGARIGVVGAEGSGAMVYFEIRHGGDTVDPRPFFGLAVD